jgi:hypothetical protein
MQDKKPITIELVDSKLTEDDLQIIRLLTRAIQELTEKVKELESRINATQP